jgi:hypothetical protein
MRSLPIVATEADHRGAVRHWRLGGRLVAKIQHRPTQPVPVIRQHPEEPIRELDVMKWGLVPHWSRDAVSTINAKSETAATKPACRDAVKYRRCLIPADGFYEWEESRKPNNELKKVLPAGMTFPYDFGFVPSTEAHIEVPTTREELVVERAPGSGREAAGQQVGSGEKEIRIPLTEERIHVEKKPVVNEARWKTPGTGQPADFR